METNYPASFVQKMKTALGAEFEVFLQSLDGEPITSIRLNPNKPISKFDSEEIVPWCGTGRYLQKRPSFTFDPLFHAGTYYVQEASSMFVEQVWNAINIQQPLKVLDLCAAPGGKSTHLLSLMNEEGLLVTNEIIPNRNKILQQNIIQWGNSNCIITQNNAGDFAKLGPYFDVILIDAPCSGEGLFRKDKNAVNEWSEENVAMCSTRQKEILDNVVQCLKPGGYLIYSTCTYEYVENDEQVEYLLNKGFETQQLEAAFGTTKTKYGLQFYPHKIKGEGFYIALLKKEGELKPSFNVGTGKAGLHADILNQYVEAPERFITVTKNDLLFAVPKNISNDFGLLSRHLYVRNAGLFLGSFKGKDFLPSHDLAVSLEVNKQLPAVELTYEQAIAYLRCETIKVDPELRGWCLVRFEGKNLGWIKAVQGRVNNYYPKEWRILKQGNFTQT